jgi:hypothetical protein
MHLLTHAEWWGEEAMPRNLRTSTLLHERAGRVRRAVLDELGMPVDNN